MPNYTFKCIECNNIFEKFMTIKDLNEVRLPCESCGSQNISRLFKPPSSKIRRSKEEIIEAAKDEARQIAEKINSGDQSAIRDIYGDS